MLKKLGSRYKINKANLFLSRFIRHVSVRICNNNNTTVFKIVLKGEDIQQSACVNKAYLR